MKQYTDHLVLVMADVSGKGVSAALFMVVSRTLMRSCITGDIPLEQAAEEINSRLCSNNKNGMFVMAWMGSNTCKGICGCTREIRFWYTRAA